MIRIVTEGDRRIAAFNARPAFPDEARCRAWLLKVTANGYGCRFDIVGRSADEVENLTARFVRLGVREGLFSQRETTPDGGDSAGQPGAASTPAREPEG